MSAFYNEHDPYAAEWLRNLIAAGHIAPGVVSEDDIRDLRPVDLQAYTQVHLFAGIGVWSHALRSAGWADDRPIWTGSCPCQPFSAAGQRAGEDDERHLWPHFHWLIDQCRPPVVLGEQVASKDGLGWLDLVSADMEASGYAFGASDLCAAGFGGAHIRQRLYFVGLADAASEQHDRSWDAGASGWAEYSDGSDVGGLGNAADQPRERDTGELSGTQGSLDGARLAVDGGVPVGPQHAGAGMGGLADTDGWNASAERQQPGRQHRQQKGDDRAVGRLADAEAERRGRDGGEMGGASGSDGREAWQPRKTCSADRSAVADQPTHAPMLGRHAADWLYCRDGKWRPVEPGTFPLADAAPQRVGRLRAYGNALDAETAAGFVEAVMDAAPMAEMLS